MGSIQKQGCRPLKVTRLRRVLHEGVEGLLEGLEVAAGVDLGRLGYSTKPPYYRVPRAAR